MISTMGHWFVRQSLNDHLINAKQKKTTSISLVQTCFRVCDVRGSKWFSCDFVCFFPIFFYNATSRLSLHLITDLFSLSRLLSSVSSRFSHLRLTQRTVWRWCDPPEGKTSIPFAGVCFFWLFLFLIFKIFFFRKQCTNSQVFINHFGVFFKLCSIQITSKGDEGKSVDGVRKRGMGDLLILWLQKCQLNSTVYDKINFQA